MSGEWKDKTCEKCEFRISSWEDCRRFPPTFIGIGTHYPCIKPNNKFLPACAEYKESSK